MGRNSKSALLHGVGVCDASTIDENKKQLKSYHLWKSMLARCYKLGASKTSCYHGCTVDITWHRYSKFAKWFDKNYIVGYHLDKDLLIQGNTVYGPNTCVFVPQYINNLIVTRKTLVSGLPRGVHFDHAMRRYVVNHKARGKHGKVGTFTDIQTAKTAYNKAKVLSINAIASEAYKAGDIQKRVYLALKRYAKTFA